MFSYIEYTKCKFFDNTTNEKITKGFLISNKKSLFYLAIVKIYNEYHCEMEHAICNCFIQFQCKTSARIKMFFVKFEA